MKFRFGGHKGKVFCPFMEGQWDFHSSADISQLTKSWTCPFILLKKSMLAAISRSPRAKLGWHPHCSYDQMSGSTIAGRASISKN